MNYIGKGIQTLEYVTKKNLYVVADFDRTLTTNSHASWGVLSRSSLTSEQAKKELEKQYEKYYPIEMNPKLDFNYRLEQIKQWYKEVVDSLVRCNISEKDMIDFFLRNNDMQFKTGAKEFLELMHKFQIPVIIISAGVGNLIKVFLEKNNSYCDNVYLCSNMLKFDNGILSGIDGEIIHSLNKEEAYMPEYIKRKLERRKKILLLGDLIGDIRMVDENKRNDTIRVCLLNDKTIDNLTEYMKYFDIACTEETGYMGLNKLLLKKIA